jgi:hypothetical protein
MFSAQLHRPLLLGLAILAASAGQTPSAHAFSARFHEEITRKALAPSGWSTEAVNDVNVGDLKTDQDEFNDHPAHFDSEAFEAGSARLRAKLDACIGQLKVGNLKEAREQFGRGFHAIQDFFAHSNFVDTYLADSQDPSKSPLDLLNLKNPRPEVQCTPPLFKAENGELTTGYFPDNWKPFPHKCTHAEMNKDHDIVDAAGRTLNPWARGRAAIECARYEATLMTRLQTEIAAGHLSADAIERLKGAL